MNTDSSFYTGKTHSVCQDFTRTKNGTKPYAILCDGCSGSPDTDTGARLLALATERTFAINDEYPYGDFKSIVATTASNMAASCGLKHDCLDATLLIASPVVETEVDQGDVIANKPAVHVQIYGDGVVAVKKKNGTINVYSIEYTQGYPYYLTYHFDKKRGEIWQKKVIGGPTEQKKNIVGTAYLLKKDWTIENQYRSDYDPNVSYLMDFGEKELTKEEKDRLSKVMPPLPFFVYPYGSHVVAVTEETEWVAMMSDGVHTFREKSSEPGIPNRQIPLIEVLKDLLDFKGFVGEFVRRQTNWFVKEAAKRNWQHDDDISVAAFYLG